LKSFLKNEDFNPSFPNSDVYPYGDIF